jgi:RNA polymerase sigma-70 factor (ECF subfamily)
VQALGVANKPSLPAPAVIVDRYGPYLERLLGRLVGWDPELPDLVQEVFLQAFQYMGKIKNPAALRTWLGRIAIFTACMFLRKRRRRRGLLLLVPSEELPDRGAPAAAPEVRSAVHRVTDLLASLPAEDRTVFLERFVDGRKVCDMADDRGVSLSTMKRALSRAETRFLKVARRDPLLRGCLAGSRWELRQGKVA